MEHPEAIPQIVIVQMSNAPDEKAPFFNPAVSAFKPVTLAKRLQWEDISPASKIFSTASGAIRAFYALQALATEVEA